MSAEELQILSTDISENGLQKRILLTNDGTILVDGRSRLRACGIAGVEPRFSYLPKNTSEADVLRLMVSANVRTRKLTPGQLAMIGLELSVAIKGFTETDFVNYPPLRSYDNQTVRSHAASVVGVSSKTLWQAKTILEYQPQLADSVRAGTVPLNTAYERVMTDRGLRSTPRTTTPSLSRKPPPGRDSTRKGVEARHAWLKHLAGRNMSASEISEQLNINEEHVRKLARRYNIELPGDAWSYKRRKPNLNVNRIAQVVADDLVAMEDSLPRIKENYEQIEPEKAEEWARIYWRTARQLGQIAKLLHYGTPSPKRTNGNNDSSS